MLTRALNAPFPSALIIAQMRITALWTVFWLALTKQIPPWMLAPTVCPSAKSDPESGGNGSSGIACYVGPPKAAA